MSHCIYECMFAVFALNHSVNRFLSSSIPLYFLSFDLNLMEYFDYFCQYNGIVASVFIYILFFFHYFLKFIRHFYIWFKLNVFFFFFFFFKTGVRWQHITWNWCWFIFWSDTLNKNNFFFFYSQHSFSLWFFF